MPFSCKDCYNLECKLKLFKTVFFDKTAECLFLAKIAAIWNVNLSRKIKESIMQDAQEVPRSAQAITFFSFFIS